LARSSARSTPACRLWPSTGVTMLTTRMPAKARITDLRRTEPMLLDGLAPALTAPTHVQPPQI
jgi:hypothetical protein